jgi:tellurite resistance-related uncharacterized protein
MTALPAGVTRYKETQVYDGETMPAGLRRRHSTKAGVWGLIRVLEGRLLYRVLDPPSEMLLDPEHPGLAAPQQPHEVEPLGPVRFRIAFYR